MKKLIFILVLFFNVVMVLSGCETMPVKNTTSWQDDGLMGHIKTITKSTDEYDYTYTSYHLKKNYTGEVKKRFNLMIVGSYDSNGKKTEETAFCDFKKTRRTSYKYDPLGYLVEDEDFSQVGYDKNNYKYYSNGKLKKIIHYNSNETVFEYDSSGRIIGKKEKDGVNDDKCYTYKYDEKGRMVEEIYNYGSSQHSTFFKYDAGGNLVEKSMSGYAFSYEPVNTTYSYKFDSNGNKIEEEKCEYNKEKELLARYILKYDSRGNKIEQTKLEDKSFDGKIKSVPVENTKWTYEFY